MASARLASRFARLSLLAVTAIGLAARTANALPPVSPCAPVVRFDDATSPPSNPTPKAFPKNIPGIPFSVSVNSNDAAALAKGTMFLAPTVPAAGDPPQRSALTLSASAQPFIALAALPAGIEEGAYDLSYEAPCIDGPPDSVTPRRSIVIGPEKPFPTTLGSVKVTFDSGKVVEQGVAIRTTEVERGLYFTMAFTPSPELAAFASVAHLDVTIVPATQGARQNQSLGLRLDETGSVTYAIRAQCLHEGPARLMIVGGLHGQGDLAPLEVEVGNCTADDVAATKEMRDAASACSASGRRPRSSNLPILAAGALAFVGLQVRRRRSESSKRPGC